MENGIVRVGLVGAGANKAHPDNSIFHCLTPYLWNG